MMKKLLIACLALVMLASPAAATTRLKNICRIKGQEENVLRGYGLVVGLKGTGDANDPITMQALARSMEIMGSPLAMNGQVRTYEDLRRIKNASVVLVTAIVPSTGARRGDKLDCYVSGINGKSLAGGRLAFAALQGPNTEDARVYALCQGQILLDDPNQPMGGVIHGGCLMEADIFTPFVRDGNITLVLDKNHANFQTADEISKMIWEQMASYGDTDSKRIEETVRAIDAANIIVRIPRGLANDPVAFAADILETRITEPEPEARVVINARAGTIVISGEVEIGDVVVSHQNVIVEADAQPEQVFNSIDIDQSNRPKLDALVAQLNALRVSTNDVIEIIRGIDRNGKLHGRLIIEDQ